MQEPESSRLSVEDLSARTGEPTPQLRHWQALGLIGSVGEGFTAEDVQRSRLIQFALRRGFSAEAIARAEKEWGGVLSNQMEILFPRGVGRTYPLAEGAAIAGLELAQARRIAEACGVGGELLDEDIEMLTRAKHAFDAGFPEEALLQLLRVHTDSLGRVAEADVRLFHFYVHERLRVAGLAGPELLEATRTASRQLRPMIEPLMLYAHGKGMARALREDLLRHLAEADGAPPAREAPAQLRLAIVFTDLSSFTPLAQTMGDVVAANVVDRFSELVREAAHRHEGQVVERLGDAFMIVFPDPRSAVRCAVEIEERCAGESQFPAVRSGVHWGEILYREGGYVGSNVNIAARIAAQAGRHQTLVSAAIQRETNGVEGIEFVPLGERRLKGLTDEVELFEARRRGAEAVAKAVDPVCGMELAPAAVAARLSVGGKQYSFCAEQCLRLFVAAPEHYGA